ncbi:hypothetical protein D3C71_1658390 [compost metagenome]
MTSSSSPATTGSVGSENASITSTRSEMSASWASLPLTRPSTARTRRARSLAKFLAFSPFTRGPRSPRAASWASLGRRYTRRPAATAIAVLLNFIFGFSEGLRVLLSPTTTSGPARPTSTSATWLPRMSRITPSYGTPWYTPAVISAR